MLLEWGGSSDPTQEKNAKAFFDLANLIRNETGESWESVLRVNRQEYYQI